jgi:hypothetical protein
MVSHLPDPMPDAGVVAPEEGGFRRERLVGAVRMEAVGVGPAILVGDGGAGGAAALGVGERLRDG